MTPKGIIVVCFHPFVKENLQFLAWHEQKKIRATH
jgi:hypothetical protein